MNTNPLYRALKAFLVVLLGSFAFACGEKNPENPKIPDNPEPDRDEVVINPHTVVLDESRLDQIVEYTEEYMIVKSLELGTPLSPETKASSYVQAQDNYYFVCSRTDQIPHGSFKKIQSITPFGNQFKVTFDMGANYGLQDIIEHGACHKSVPHSDFESITDEEGKSIPFNGNKWVVTLSDKVIPGDDKVKLSLVLTIDLDVSPEIRLSVKDGETVFQYGITAIPDVKVDTKFSISDKTDNLLELLAKKFNIRLKPILIMIGAVPVYAEPEVTLGFGISASGEVNVKGTMFHWAPSYTAGMQASFKDIAHGEPNLEPFFDKNPPAVSAEIFKDVQLNIEGSLKEDFNVESGVRLYGFTTAKVGFDIYAKQKISTGIVYDPWEEDVSMKPLQVNPSVGVDGTLKGSFKIFKWEPELKTTWTIAEFPFEPWVIEDFKSAPVVVTIDGAIASENSIMIAGAAISDDSDETTIITECGFEYYTDDPNQKTVIQSSMDGSQYFHETAGLLNRFFSTIDGLQANTTYNIRAYATNGKGTRFGKYVKIETRSSGIQTLSATNVTPTSAEIPVSVSSAFEIMEKGVIYSKNDNPTMTGQGAVVVKSEGQSNDFSVTLSDLETDVTYYARGYIIISTGNSSVLYLGNVISFTTHESVIPETNLVAYYPFNGNADDESGNGHHGTVNGNVTLTTDRFGNENSAYFFPGSSWNYISVPHSDELNLDEFTLSAWIFSDNESTGYGFEKSGYIINKGRDIEDGSYRLRARSVGAEVLYAGKNDAIADLSPEIGQWHMVSGTVSGDVARFYIDGELVKENTLSKAFTASNNSELCIGMHYYPGVPTKWAYPHYGKIDDVFIYQGAMSPSQIKELYNALSK